MKKQMTIWGVGPLFAFFSFVYFTFTLIIHFAFYPLFRIESISYAVLAGLGFLLFCIGIVIWIISAQAIVKGFSQGALVTHGVYAICRHPLYGQGIFYTFPGLLMFFRSYILLTLPLFMYIIFRLLISSEEKYLHDKFGEDFIEYKQSVNMVFPKFWKMVV